MSRIRLPISTLFFIPCVALFVGACSTATPHITTVATPSTTTTTPACPSCPICPAPINPPQESTSVPQPQPSSWEKLPGWQEDNLSKAWKPFYQSCTVLKNQAAWRATCELAFTLGPALSPENARQFFETHFTPWQLINTNNTTEGLITGYYEPLIKGSRTQSTQYRWPVHAVPDDMLTIDLGELYPALKTMRLRGRLVGKKIVPYWSRSELEQKGSALPARILLWAADPIDLFFLQIQGSGRVELPDGSHVRIGYADQNGHPYHSIGRWLISQGELSAEQASMDGIRNWAYKNPTRLSELLNNNPSYVFFRELPASSSGPIGSLGLPVNPERTLAIDPQYILLGAPVFLSTTYPLSTRPLQRLMVAQDTGGAIKGPVRADFFWGFGHDAGTLAGRMRQQGQLWMLLPNGIAPESLR